MKMRIVLILLFVLGLVTPLIVNAALTKEGIYRIEFDRMSSAGGYKYYYDNQELTADQFMQKLFDLQCDGSGMNKSAKVVVSIPEAAEGNTAGVDKLVEATWKITMPYALKMYENSAESNKQRKSTGITTKCPGF